MQTFQAAGVEAKKLTPHQAVVAEASGSGRTKDVAKEILERELTPVVREAITDEVMQSIGKMVGLTTEAINRIEEDLGDPDSKVRQKAYELILRYTVGHPAMVTSKSTEDKQLVVHFNLPRPGDTAASDDDVVTVHAEELRECDMCGQSLPASAFVATSTRCKECHEEFSRRVIERFGDE